MKLISLFIVFFTCSVWANSGDFDYADMLDGYIVCELTDPENFVIDPPSFEGKMSRTTCSKTEVQPGCGEGWAGSAKGRLEGFQVEVLVGHTALYDLKMTHVQSRIQVHWNSHPIPGTLKKVLFLKSPKDQINRRIECYLR